MKNGLLAPRAWLGLYNALLVAFSPLLLAKKAAKFRAHRNPHEIDLTRWNTPQPLDVSVGPRSGDLRVVIVALSWGEVTILDQISRRLEADFALAGFAIAVVWAIRDAGDAARAKRAFPTRVITTMPFDFAWPARKWLNVVRPDLLVVVEKFWWPNLVWGAKMGGARVVLINGRSRGRDRLRYRFASLFQRWILDAFDLLLFESSSQLARVEDVLPRRARAFATGNVKFAFSAPEPPREAAALEQWLQPGGLPLLIAGSTSASDEKWALEAWQKIQLEFPCRLLLAPRRIERAGEIARQFQEAGYASSCRNLAADVLEIGAPVLILDTLGELSYLYRFGVAAYVGGAIEGRGHNIIEPLSWGKAVAYGPRRGDFEAVQRAAEDAGTGFRLSSSDELADFWRKALSDSLWRDQIARAAAQLVEEQRGALDAVVAHLESEIAALQNGAGKRG